MGLAMIDRFRVPTIGDDSGATERREVYVRGGAIAENLDDIEAALVEQQVGIFQRNGRLMRPARTIIAVRGSETVEDLGLVEVRANGLVEIVTQAADLLKYDARKKGAVRI